jgi:hypothetical protein
MPSEFLCAFAPTAVKSCCARTSDVRVPEGRACPVLLGLGMARRFPSRPYQGRDHSTIVDTRSTASSTFPPQWEVRLVWKASRRSKTLKYLRRSLLENMRNTALSKRTPRQHGSNGWRPPRARSGRTATRDVAKRVLIKRGARECPLLTGRGRQETPLNLVENDPSGHWPDLNPAVQQSLCVLE